MANQTVNPVQEQDRAWDLYSTWSKHKQVMFIQQRCIYMNLVERLKGADILEAGCGNGVGTALLERGAKSIVGTDKNFNNVAFSLCLYPWIEFRVWDIEFATRLSADVVVCVEVVEHVADPQKAIQNLVNAAKKEAWISTPNGAGKPMPPSNEFHVCEYTTWDMMDMIEVACPQAEVEILTWEHFERAPLETKGDPLVYRVKL